MLVFKPIKPKKLNQNAMLKALVKEAEKVANDIELDFEATTATWEHDVDFEKTVDVDGGGISVLVGTDDRIYGYVNNGTEEHYIFPVRAKALAFQEGYRAKTVVGQEVSRQGGPFGDVVFRDWVLHPGTEARNFDQAIEKKWRSRYKKRMEKAMKEARRVSDNPA